MQKSARILLLMFAATLAVSGAACSSCTKGSGSATAREDVALVPKETAVVGMVNLARVRDTAFWRKLLDMRDQGAAEKKRTAAEKKPDQEKDPADKPADDGVPADFEEFVAKCGFDPFKQLDSLFLALPSSVSDGEFGLIVRGTFDQAKLTGCAKAIVKKQGGELAETEYDGKKLLSDPISGTMTIAFVDGKTIVIAGKEWVKKVLDLATGKGGETARDNAPLQELMKKARTSDALWGIGLVSDSVREQLKNNEQLGAAGSLKDVYGSIDFPSGMTLTATFDVGSDADATELSKKIGEQLVEMKKNGKIMMMGLSSYIDSVKPSAQGPAFKINVQLNQQQVDDLINRIQGIFRGGPAGLLGGAMGNPGMIQ